LGALRTACPRTAGYPVVRNPRPRSGDVVARHVGVVTGRADCCAASTTNVCSREKRTCGFESGLWVLIHLRHRRVRGSERPPREFEELKSMTADELAELINREHARLITAYLAMLMGRIRASLINVEPTRTSPDRVAFGPPLLERSGHCPRVAGVSICSD